ncbi:MAG: sugar ABC transporter substrate-binding protein [Anaerolineaceae bacterium]|nr:sugar ABC transporter substrate-binding protein [Anaerolineaceae bacterium]
MKSQKLFPMFVFVLILSMLFSGCASTPATTTPPTNAPAAADQPTTAPAADTAVPAAPAAAQTTIKVVTFLTYDQNIKGAEYTVVDAFQKAHPDIKVDFQLLPYGDYFTSLKTWIAGNTAPDVASLDIAMLQEAASNGALAPLDGMITEQKVDLSSYYASTLDMFKNGGKQYGMPASFSNVVIFYNKALFDAAKLPYPDNKMDWTTYVDTAKKLSQDTNKDNKNEIFGTARAWWPLYLLMADTSPFTADGTKCNLTSPAAEKGFQAMVDLTLTDKVAPSAEELAAQSDWDMFMAGRIAMYPIGPWGVTPFNGIKEFQWDAAEMPIGPLGKKVTFLFGNAYSVLAGSKQQAAAFEFVKFATGPEGDKIRQDAGFEIAPNKSVAESSFLKSLEGKEPANAKVFLTSAEFAKMVPSHPHWTEMADAISAQLDLALLGKVTVDEAMKTACTTIDKLLSE